MKKKLFITCVLMFSLLLLVSCGKNDKSANNDKKVDKDETTDEKPVSELGDYNIVLSGEVTEEDDLFIIEGKSNLLPGSRLTGQVVVEGENGALDIYSDTTELVEEDGSFYMEVDHHQYGEAEITVKFDFDNVQEDEVKRHYGDKGQKLEGPFIYKHKDGSFNKAEARITYDPNENNDLTIKAHDWDELPEDYGDPRVWIELDEITEDGEFFYIHGESNILEGSELEAAYQNNTDKTQVNPDGSFDFRLDYEYLEDTDFVIAFKPAAYQWNQIEENYGANGQKLIGNLVVTERYNTDKQYAEIKVPLENKAASGSRQDQDNTENEDNTDSNTNDKDNEETE